MTDDFPEKLKAGCRDEESCNGLVREARDRVHRCQPNTIGYIKCSDADADLRAALELQRDVENAARKVEREERERKKHEWAEESRKRHEEFERKEQERKDLENKRRTDRETLAAEREAEKARAAEELWEGLDVERCSKEGDAPTCAALRAYIYDFPRSPHASEARMAYAAGVEVQRANEAERAAESRKPKPRAPTKHAKCCDGSVDKSCGCSGGPGCCFQKGGVCGCE